MVVLGHYEKLKEIHIGRDYVFIGYNSVYPRGYAKEDYLVNVQNDTITQNIPVGSIWRCIDVQVKPRYKDDRMSTYKRSPLALVFDNEKYGKHYCYIESQYGEAYRV